MTFLQSTSRRWLAGITVIVGLGIICGGIILNERSELDEELKAERLETATLFSGKVVLQKEVTSLKRSVERVKSKNSDLTSELSVLKREVNAKEKALQGKFYSMEQLQAELLDINALKEKLYRLNERLVAANELLENENQQLRSNLKQTESEYAQLEDDFREKSEARANYIRIEALQGKKNKQTRKASQAQRLYVSFTWPAAMGELQQGKKLYLVITGTSALKLPTPQGKVTVRLDGLTTEIEPAVIAEVQASRKERQEIILELSEKLTKGVYQADIYTDDFLLGGTQIRLD